jgi:hypothetical protein
MPEARTVALLERVERKWRPLRETAEEVGLDGLERSTSAGWTAKEMIAHVAFWEEAVEGAVRGLFRGESTEGFRFGSGYIPHGEWPRADVHNAREAASLATVTDEEIATHERYFNEIGVHFEEHLPELEALLEPSLNPLPTIWRGNRRDRLCPSSSVSCE